MEASMKIPVLLNGDDSCREIPDFLLDTLLDDGKIKAFRRSTGWVVIGRDPIRRGGSKDYNGPERRITSQKSCIKCPEMVFGECITTICPDRRRKTKFSTNK